MTTNGEGGSEAWVDPDDAPELTEDMLREAEVFRGETFVRRVRDARLQFAEKERVEVWLDRSLVDQLRQSGPGWQARMNSLVLLGLLAERLPPSGAASVQEQTDASSATTSLSRSDA